MMTGEQWMDQGNWPGKLSWMDQVTKVDNICDHLLENQTSVAFQIF